VIIEDGKVVRVRVDMGEPVLEPELIPVIAGKTPVVGEHMTTSFGDVTFTAVSMGNPHCVILVETMDDARVSGWGPEIEKHPSFPQKTNVEFVQVLSRKEVIMRVWERGAGPTLACGTGACATLVACALNGVTDRQATVHLRGGDLFIEWDENTGHVFMTGPTAYAFVGNVDLTQFEG
jgi:diaminopimelate epimerase